MRQKGFAPILIILVVLIAIGGAYYFGMKKRSVIPAPTQTPSSVETSVPSQTTPTTKPTTNPTTTSNVKVLKYKLPIGWLVATNTSTTFEVGYNPKTTKIATDTHADGVYFLRQRPDPNLGYYGCEQITLNTYNGGSRHQFIYDALGETPNNGSKFSDYKETEYIYNGKSCLFLNGISISQFNSVWGMCDAGNGKAFLITSCDRDPSNYEAVIQTIKLK